MKKTLQLALTILPIAFVLDGVWILGIAGPFYQSQIGQLIMPQPLWYAAVLFYILYAIALPVFVIKPALAANSLKHALTYGAFFGFTAYMTYDLTNLATIIGWTIPFAVVDTIWGTFMTMVLCGATYIIAKRFYK